MKDIIKELFEGGLKKIIVILISPFLPIFAIFGKVNFTGNYWWDLLICFGISGIVITLLIVSIKSKK